MVGYLVVGVVLGLWVSGIASLVDVFRHPRYAWTAAGQSRALTVVGLLVAGWVGAIYYWSVVRRRVVRAKRTVKPPRERPRENDDPWADDDWAGR